MNINTTKNLIAFLAVAFLVSAGSASAYVPGVWDPQPRVNINEPAFTKVASTYDAPVIPQTVAMNNYNPNTNPNTNTSNTNTNNTTTNTTTTTNTQPKPVVATAAKVRTTTSTNTNTSYVAPDYNNQLKPVVNTGNGLTALSVAGSGGFMPTSIWQWILIVLFILAIIIVARMLTRSDHHEVHTVTAH